MECPICLETIFKNKKILKCKHIFHKSCLNEWLINHDTCPMCRCLINYIEGKIKRKKYKIYVNNSHIVFEKDSVTTILYLVNVKRIKYNRWNTIKIYKKNTSDNSLVKLKIKTKNAMKLFNKIKSKMVA
jgi:hypothetical protein